ncbi:MAG TPA: conjugative transposon protein TraN [Flavisolibacter sp.]|nr:conjugative transposon protein TraN [Flavisolibacter sp.]
MKRHHALLPILMIFSFFNGTAQSGTSLPKDTYIEPYRLEITYNKTSNLLFPEAITSIDRGSQDILVQRADGVENILRIKAAVKSFEETNLSVVTKDGKLYSFLVCYQSNPAYLNINMAFSATAAAKRPVQPFSTETHKRSMDKSTIRDYAEKVVSATKNVGRIQDKKGGVFLQMNGIYISKDILFCRLMLQNNSNIDFDSDGLRFYVRDKKVSKRTASQETEIMPVHTTGDTSFIRSKSDHAIVIALPRFTIPDSKWLIVEVMEKRGGRHLQLKVKHNQIMKAAPLPD